MKKLIGATLVSMSLMNSAYAEGYWLKMDKKDANKNKENVIALVFDQHTCQILADVLTEYFKNNPFYCEAK